MPLRFSHCATLTPSPSHASRRRAPPGATTAAAPVAVAAGGRYTVTLGSLTFTIVRSPAGDVVVVSGIAQFSDPGALPGQRRISCGVCAATSTASATTAAASTAQMGRDIALPHAFLLDRPDRLRAQAAVGAHEPLRGVGTALQLVVQPGDSHFAEPAAALLPVRAAVPDVEIRLEHRHRRDAREIVLRVRVGDVGWSPDDVGDRSMQARETRLVARTLRERRRAGARRER